MKTQIKKTALVAAIGMLAITKISAQDILASRKEASKVILNIEVSDDNSNLRNATVKIYRDKESITVENTGLKRNMRIPLRNNSYYIVEVCSPGFATKSFLVSTVFPIDTLHADAIPYEHTISVSLCSDSTSMGPDANPSKPFIGIIYYRNGKDDFLGCPW